MGLDYIQPGNWIHDPYVTVSNITIEDNMSEPDTIKSGWHMWMLWGIWVFLFTLSIICSLILAHRFGSPRK